GDGSRCCGTGSLHRVSTGSSGTGAMVTTRMLPPGSISCACPRRRHPGRSASTACDKRDPCIWTPCATTREKRAQGPPSAGATRYREAGHERAVVRRVVRTASHWTFGPSLLLPAHRNREGGPCAIATPGSLRIDYVSGSPEPSFGPREQRTATPIPIVVRVG